jgi:hypothetical protein
MRTTLLTLALVGSLVGLTASPTGLGAPSEHAASFPGALVGRWSRTVSHDAWLKAGRDFATTKVTIDVDRTGTRVGYFGPDFNPGAAPSPGPANPDWYTDWKTAGSKLRIGAVPPCGWVDSWSGAYRWSRSGTTLRITKMSDKCRDRAVIFAGTWKKVR